MVLATGLFAWPESIERGGGWCWVACSAKKFWMFGESQVSERTRTAEKERAESQNRLDYETETFVRSSRKEQLFSVSRLDSSCEPS